MTIDPILFWFLCLLAIIGLLTLTDNVARSLAHRTVRRRRNQRRRY